MPRCPIVAAVVALGLTLAPASAIAQTQCLEGRTAAGVCVDVALGSMIRERVRVFTQPRLSYAGPAVVPSRDRQYDALRDGGQWLRSGIFPCTGKSC